jgi:hypothetical protein
MKNVHVELNLVSPWDYHHTARERYFHHQTGFQFKEETTKLVALYDAET